MIQFSNWTISALCGEVIARQYDNLSRTLTVMGDLPAGWDWSMLVDYGDKPTNVIALSPVGGGIGATLTADMIPYAGYYRMQLRGTQGEAVRHTNIIRVYIPESLTGEGQWPDLPSEFGQIEERMQELAGQAQDSADAADTSAKAAAESAAAAQGAEESVAANAKAAQDAANAAQTSEGNAKTSETNAAKSAGDAQTSAGQAADSATQAKTAQGKAEAAQTAAETAQGKAETAAGTATQAAQGAVTSAGQASQSAQEAASAATAAQNAQEAAEKAQGQAEAQATAAAGSATAAQESAAAAAGSSSSASGSAQTAQTAAQNAQKSAETAQEARQGAQAAQQAIEDLEVSSETLEPDSPASVEKTVSPEGVVTLEFGIPRGPQGPPGVDAPQINDAIITDANPWSAKKIVDTLAPPFSSSGAIVTCNPVAGYPLHVVSQIEPVQEGTGDPSPENVRPITGWMEAETTVCGKNLLDFDGTITILQNIYSYGITRILKPSIEKLPRNTPIVFSADWSYYTPKGTYKTLSVYVDGKAYMFEDGSPNELPDGEITLVVIYAGNDKTQDSIVSNLRFTPGSTPAPYEPYNGSTITLPLGQTVYGGTLDWQTGVLTVEWKLIEFDGTETWSKYAAASNDVVIVFVIVIPDAANGFQTSICNQFKNLDTTWSRGIPWTYSDYPTLPNKYFCVQTSKFPDVDSWKSYLAAQYAAGTPVQVCYKLDTPQPIQATGGQTIPALSGTNTIYTDTGDTTVSGRADPNTIIQQLAARIAALEGQAINR